MKETQTIYYSPKVKVVEIKTRKMLCASDSSVEKMTFNTDNGDNWE